ncbi:EpsG family protein [Lelliottia jeotgali]
MKVSRATVYELVLALALLALGALLGLKESGIWQDRFIYDAYYAMGSELPLQVLVAKPDALFYLLIRAWDGAVGGKDVLWCVLGAVSLLLTGLSIGRASERPVAAFVTYASFLIWVQIYTQVRMALALSLCLASIYLWRNARVTSVVARVAACFIHSSLVVVVLGYSVLDRIRISRRRVFLWSGIVGFSVVLLSYYALPYVTFEKVAVYYELLREGGHARINLFSALPALQVATLAVIALTKRTSEQVDTAEYRLAMIGALSFYALSAVPVFAVRVNELLSIFFIIVLTNSYRKSWPVFAMWLAYLAFSIKSAALLLTTELVKQS